MTMAGMIADRLKKFAVRRTAGGWSGVLLVAMGLVVLMLPVPAAGQGLVINDPPEQYGTIDYPEPYEGGEDRHGNPFPPGCRIRFTRSPAPGAPCAVVCTGTAKGKFTEDQKRDWCTAPNSDNTFSCSDANGHDLPDCKGYDPANGCTELKGAPGQTVGFAFFPHGHPRCFGVSGEPHLSTFDDLRYDLQAAGEFVAAKSLDDNLEVQVRLQPFAGFDDVSVATAVAARMGDDRIMIAAKTGTPLRVNGEPVELTEDRLLWNPADGSMIIKRSTGYSLVWPDGTNLHVEVAMGRHLDFFLLTSEPRDGRLVGLSGDADGDDGGDDFRTRAGEALAAPPEFETLYKVFAESWRITPEESLFDYAEGESTETFTNRDIPRRKMTLADLDPGARGNAERLCREAGVVETVALEQCVFDVGLTGDITFIDSALAQQTPPEFRLDEEQETIVISAPAEGIAAHDIEVGIRGHEKGSWFGFAPAESTNAGKASNPYSDVILRGDEETVKLVVPTIPGEYELRYREAGGERKILARKAFRSTRPQIRIEAPDTAKAGGSLEVRLLGNIGERMTVTVVPADSPDSQKDNPLFYTVQGTEMNSVLRGLPEQPGEYEIRCVSDWGAAQVYARHKLEIE